MHLYVISAGFPSFYVRLSLLFAVKMNHHYYLECDLGILILPTTRCHYEIVFRSNNRGSTNKNWPSHRYPFHLICSSVGWSVSQSVSQPVYWQRQVKKGSSLIIVPFIIMIGAYFQVCWSFLILCYYEYRSLNGCRSWSCCPVLLLVSVRWHKVEKSCQKLLDCAPDGQIASNIGSVDLLKSARRRRTITTNSLLQVQQYREDRIERYKTRRQNT